MGRKQLFLVMCTIVAILFAVSCVKNQKGSNNGRLQVMLTDGPDPSVKEVWVDIQQIEILMSDTGKAVILNGVHPGLYNLLDFANGKDTILADATIPSGTISQIRLILGDNNYVI